MKTVDVVLVTLIGQGDVNAFYLDEAGQEWANSGKLPDDWEERFADFIENRCFAPEANEAYRKEHTENFRKSILSYSSDNTDWNDRLLGAEWIALGGIHWSMKDAFDEAKEKDYNITDEWEGYIY